MGGDKSGDHGLIWSTFLGGNDGIDIGCNLVLDGSGRPVVGGRTDAYDFPATPGAWQEDYAGISDAFVAKLTADGSGLVWATYLGGTDRELDVEDAYAGHYASDLGLALDAQERPIVTGWTLSDDFPLVNAADGIKEGGLTAFVTTLAADGDDLVWSTFFGANLEDSHTIGRALALDANGDIFIAGYTSQSGYIGSNLPETEGTYNPNYLSGVDGFVAKLFAATGAPDWATYLTGSVQEIPSEVLLPPSGDPVIVGTTNSHNFMWSNGPQYNYDAFVVQITSDGSDLGFVTFIREEGAGSLGGDEFGMAVAADAAGNLYVTGTTTSLREYHEFHTTPGVFQPDAGGGFYDGYVCKLDPVGNVIWASYLGGEDSDRCADIALDANGRVVILGNTRSQSFPVTAGAYATEITNSAFDDLFLVTVAGDGSLQHDGT